MLSGRALAIEIVVVTAICLCLTLVNALLQPSGAPVSDIAWLAAICSLFALPAVAVRYVHPRDEKSAGTALEWSWPDLRYGLAISALLLVPVALGNHFARVGLSGMDFRFAWQNFGRMEMPFYYEIPIQFLCIALPEEFFYRGYLMTNLQKLLSGARSGAKYVPVAAIVISSMIFALAHFPTGGAERLLTFFPGLLFGFIRYRTGGILGAAACHAACNLMMVLYGVHYFVH